MHKYFKYLLAIAALPLLVACGNKDAQQQKGPPPAVPVVGYTVRQQSVTGTDNYTATVVPLQEVELRPQVPGYITNIFVQDGQKVKQGQQLYEIDRSKYQAAHRQATADVQSARANLNRVQQDVERYERLLERDAIARQQVDYARADLQTAQANVAAAQARVASVNTDLGYSLITAPFDGTIGISQVRVGAQVSPGQPLLNTISTEDPIAVDFAITEQEVPRFNRMRQGSQPDTLFTLTLADGSRYNQPGKIVAIDRAIGRQTGTITVRLQFPNPQRQLLAGMTTTVNVLNQDIGKQLVIPYRAVTEQLGEYFAYKIQGDSVVQQRLQLGTRVDDLIIVREGLEAGENIVLEGIQKLRQGAKVNTGGGQK